MPKRKVGSIVTFKNGAKAKVLASGRLQIFKGPTKKKSKGGSISVGGSVRRKRKGGSISVGGSLKGGSISVGGSINKKY